MERAAPTAVVVGGGIGGLTAALALQRIGWSVVVLERAPEPADSGSGITLFPNALRALDAIGAGDRVRSVGAPLPRGSGGLRRPNGQVIVDGSAVPSVADLYAFARADLHRALRDQLGAGILRTGIEVTEVRTEGGYAVVSTADGQQHAADVVVAADGGRSAIRSALHPRHRGLRPAGYTSWRALVSEPVDLRGVTGETWGAGERFGILPLGDGRTYWFAVANRPVSRTGTTGGTTGRTGGGHGEVLRRFGRWHAPITDLLSATPPEAVLSLDIHDLHLPLPRFAVGRVALLGDAAHAMTPDIGQGAGQACEDAAVLGALLSGSDDVVTALQRYDAVRRPRAEKIVAAARRTDRLAQTSAPLAVALRTALLRVAPPSASLRMITAITAWEAPVLSEVTEQ